MSSRNATTSAIPHRRPRGMIRLPAAVAVVLLGVWLASDSGEDDAFAPALPDAISADEAEHDAGSDSDAGTGRDEAATEGGAEGATAASGRETAVEADATSGVPAVAAHVDTLREGLDRLRSVSGYTTVMHRRERIGGSLGEEDVVELAVRHEPYSVHMEWLNGEKGRRVAYVEGENDGKMLVRFGGWKSRFPPMHVDPHGSLAGRRSRYPITEAGLLPLARRLVEHREEDLDRGDGFRCRRSHVVWKGRPCCEIVVEYEEPDVSSVASDYRKSVLYVDSEWCVPVYVRNYGWPHDDETFAGEKDLDAATLIEVYAYTDLEWNPSLADADFDVER